MASSDTRDRPHIARIVHRLHSGDKDIEAAHEAHWQAWQRQLPDWEFRTWQAADLAALPAAALLARTDDPQQRAHIACYAILHAHGGLWLDGEIVPYHPFDPAWEGQELVVCNEVEANAFCTMGFIAAAPGAAALGWALDALGAMELGRKPASLETGPWLLARALAHGPHRMLPPHTFYPYRKDEPVSSLYTRDLADTRGIRAWKVPRPLAGNPQLRRALDLAERGDLRAAVDMLGERDTYTTRALRTLCGTARAQRTALLEAAQDKVAASRVRIDATAAADLLPLALLKVAFFLLTEVPDLLVWQLGAGDGVNGDPLRALLVNFDPHAVLIEPDPQRFTALQQNYRNNTRAGLFHCAYALDPGYAVLHRPDPDKLAAAGVSAAAASLASTTPERVHGRTACFDPAARIAIARAMTTYRVDALDLGGLLALHNDTDPGIVVSDMNGSDFDLMFHLLDYGIRPFILHYPTDVLAPHEIAILDEKLQRDYVSFRDGTKTVAYRSDMFKLYCDQLYVEYGIPTIYRDAFRLLLGF
jgi:hypothetical protein